MATLTNAEVRRFLLWTFALTLPPQLWAVFHGFEGGAKNVLLLAMWAPAVAALVSSAASRRIAVAALKKTGWRLWLPALVLGSSFVLLEMGWLAATGTGHWNSEMFPLLEDGSGVAKVKAGVVLGNGPQGFAFFALNVAISVALATLLLAIFGGVGEELGWRAVLQPELARRFGTVKGTVVVGLIWGFWHLPVNLSGYNDDQHPLLSGLVLMQVFTIAFSFVLGWLTAVSRSVWPAAIAHAANNTLGAGRMVEENSWDTGIAASMLAAVVVGGFFLWRASRSRAPEHPALITAPVRS